MENYANLGGNSNVVRYKLETDSLIVEFASGQDSFYKYTYASAGSGAVESMKILAKQGRGLNAYISTHKPPYAAKTSSLAGL